MSPPIIMADEPTGNLDTQSGNEIMRNLIRLNDEGTTVILITHDLQLARFAKRVIMIRDGKIISDGPSDPEMRLAALNEVAV